MTRRACLIVNPVAGRGRGARLLPHVAQAFAARGITDIRPTVAPGDEVRQVRAALDDGCDTIAVLGGDGTWSKAAAELVRHGCPARLALISAGTGNDFVKNLPEPSGAIEAMARLVAGDAEERRVDMATVDGELFLNVAGFAFDVAVLARTQRTRWLAGAALYAVAALQELFAYRGLEVAIDDAPYPSRYLLLAFANGAHFGGMFHVAPGARIDDGMLDAIAIADVGALGRPALLARAARGTHLSHPRVSARRAATFSLRFAAPPLYEADGELRRATSTHVRVESRPGVLRVLVPPGSAG
ncbi:MAG TPA: diacylglycerol kinase family protein [Gemmatimonadaceae bacterium]|nr:diacylglycerol kinase family protein [Gemmatimonadaceae bacterium]